jgi:hypothetical protein
MKKMRNELIGKVFTKLKVLSHSYSDEWLCECACGKKIVVSSCKLNSGHTKSCGCLKRKHGFWNTNYSKGTMKFYKVWQSLRARCDNPNLKCYKNYGGRGITYDSRWKEFENFKKDMYFKYLYAVKQQKLKNASIERMDVNGNYNFENCIFIERTDQLKNSRAVISFIAISPEGEEFSAKNVNEFSKKYGFNSTNIYACLDGRVSHHRKWRFKEINSSKPI